MIKKFLKAKHWQIFTITIGLPFLIQLVMISIGIIGHDPMVIIKLFPIVMILFIGGFFLWFWSVGVGLQSKIPADIKMKVGRFKTFLIIPLVYIILLLGFVGFSILADVGSGLEAMGDMITRMLGVIIPLHFFSMFCMVYCLYFVAKTFKTVELQKDVSFSDFAEEFFIFWFFPIGIWIVQPKINKMIEN